MIFRITGFHDFFKGGFWRLRWGDEVPGFILDILGILFGFGF